MLAPWKKSYDQSRQHIQKQRHYFATKVRPVKAMVFPVVMFGCESWTIKKAEHWRSDAFELWCWRRLLRVPWTARRSNQSILKEISPGCSLEGLMLKLRYFGHLMQRANSFQKTLMLGGIEGRRRRGWQRMRWLDGITDWWTCVSASSGSWWSTRKPGVLQSMGLQRVGHNWVMNWEDQFITSSVDQLEEANYYTIRFLLRNIFLSDKIAKVVINTKKLRYNLHTMKFTLSKCSVVLLYSQNCTAIT